MQIKLILQYSLVHLRVYWRISIYEYSLVCIGFNALVMRLDDENSAVTCRSATRVPLCRSLRECLAVTPRLEL